MESPSPPIESNVPTDPGPHDTAVLGWTGTPDSTGGGEKPSHLALHLAVRSSAVVRRGTAAPDRLRTTHESQDHDPGAGIFTSPLVELDVALQRLMQEEC
jgi:hypothetical protein